jgi:GABA permease
LQAGLKNRHLSMIAIGGVIGAGLFVGSSSGIATTGPGILLSYALVGTLVVLVMRMLGEMSAANPTSGSFSAHADRALGPWAGFSIGWLYWFFWVVVLAVEATAGAAILEGWIPAVPQWGWALIVAPTASSSSGSPASRSSPSPPSSSSAAWPSSACCPESTATPRGSPT